MIHYYYYYFYYFILLLFFGYFNIVYTEKDKIFLYSSPEFEFSNEVEDNSYLIKGSSLLLHCLLIGSHNVTWFQNDQPIKASKNSFLFSNGSLLIKSSTDHSTGNKYYCIAHLRQQKRALVSKITQLVTMEDKTERVGVVRGGGVVMSCFDENFKDLNKFCLKWFKNGIELKFDHHRNHHHHQANFLCNQETSTFNYNASNDNNNKIKKNFHFNFHSNQNISNKMILHSNGALEIVTMTTSNYGSYECHVTKRFSHNSINLSTYLLIEKENDSIDLLTFTKSPENLKVLAGTDVTLTCSFEIAKGNHLQFEVFWSKKGSILEENKSIKKIGGCSLLLLNVSIDVSGSYELNIISKQNGVLFKKIFLQVLEKPKFTEPITEIETEKNQDLTLTCPTKGHPRPEVTWYKDGNLIKDSDVVVREEGGVLKLWAVQLEDQGFYQCVAFNEAGSISRFGFLQLKYQSESPELMQREEVDLVAEASDSTTISVAWNQTKAKPNKWQLILKEPKNSKIKTEIVSKDEFKFTFKDLKKNNSYQIMVKGIFQEPLSPSLTPPLSPTLSPSLSLQSSWVSVNTPALDFDETRPPDPPRFISLVNQGDSLKVKWEAPGNRKMRVRGYELGYGWGKPDENIIKIPSTSSFFVIHNLEPLHEYVVRLNSYNGAGRSRLVYDSIFLTPHIESKVSLEPPFSLQVLVTSGTSVTLHWSDPSYLRLQKNRGSVEGRRVYVVRFNPKNHKRFKTLNTSSLHTEVTGLKPHTEYEFKVKVVSKGGKQSPWSLGIIERTSEAAPSSPPEDLQILPADEDGSSLLLSWKPPKHTNGIITGFHVYYTDDSSIYESKWEKERVGGEQTSVPIEGLRPGSIYFFKVQALNKAGEGPESLSVLYRTPDFHVTGDPRDDELKNIQFQNQMVTLATEHETIKREMVWLLVGVALGVVFVASFIVAVILFLKCRPKQTLSSNEDKKSRSFVGSTSPDPSSEKSSLKPPDLWTHGRHNSDLLSEDQEDGCSLIEKWTIKSNSIANSKSSKFKMSSLLKNENDPNLNINYSTNTIQYHNSSITPRVFVGDLRMPEESLSSCSQSDIPPPMPPLSSPHLVSLNHPKISSLKKDCFLNKRESTENLSAEMANIEGLMKDLRAISQSQGID